jgi:RND family efflux transporter MFP subunit
LLAQGAIAGREVQISEADEIQAKASYDAAKTKLTLIEQHTSADDLRIAEGALNQAKAHQQLAAANLSFTELRSPMDGSVTDQTMFPGDLANPSVPIFALADLSSAVARAQIDADQAVNVKVGQVCSFTLRANAIQGATDRFGKVTVVNQAVDQARHTVEVWCEIANSDHILKTGLFGTVKVAIGEASSAVVIPTSAIEFEEGSNNAKVYVVDGQKVAHIRKVTAVTVDDHRVRILSGLNRGETVITKGEYGLPDGTSVEVRQ